MARPKLKLRKKHKILNSEEQIVFAQALVNGKVLKQLVAKYDISLAQGYVIANKYLKSKWVWKNE